MPEFFATSSTSEITGIVGNLFSSLRPLIFLIIGVFLALFIFEILVEMMRQRTWSFLTGTDVKDLKEFSQLAKRFGEKIDFKQLKKEFAQQKAEKRFLALKKKFGVPGKSDEGENVPIRIVK